MKDRIKKLSLTMFAVFAAVGLAFVPSGGHAALAAESYEEKEDGYYDYVQKFNDLTQVNNVFHAYYLEQALGSSKADEVTDDAEAKDSHWYIQNGEIRRINDIKKNELTGKYETNQIAMLTFTKEAYLNFELSVDYQRGRSGFWPVVAIRQLEEGKYYLDDGAGVFVQQNGTVTLWGDEVISGPYEFGSIDGYSDTAWHNLQIKVVGNVLEVSVDYSPYMTENLPEEFYDTGYVSLVSVNNETKYRNFRIKALPEPEKEGYKDFAPVPEADRDDALSKLAGEVKDKDALFEREGKVNPDLVYTSEISRYIESGCSGRIGGSVCLVSAVALCGIVLYNRKR